VAIAATEPLSTRPTVTFTQPGRAGVKVVATRLSDGSYRAAFTVATGAAGTGSIMVAAKDSAGRGNVTSVAVAIGAR
jgi:hypothetical protein